MIVENYRYKVVVELDDDKIRLDGYDLDDTYRIVRELFLKNGLKDVSKGNTLIFVSEYGDEDAYSNICIVTNILYRDWTNPYLKVMEWHNLKKGSVEDVLSIFNECKKKYGD